MKKSTVKEFIFKARSIHGDKYDYSEIDYINAGTKVKIRCSLHGEFWQYPNTHIHQKSGCSSCSRNKKLITGEFIKRAMKVHGNRYDYSKTIYVTARTPLLVTCFKHGDFNVSSDNHIRLKSGCPECHRENLSKLFRGSSEDFMKRAEKLHRNKYDYSLVVYGKNSHENVKILCKKHGEFYQAPSDHLKGNGCPKCISRISKPEVEFLNYLKIPDTHQTRQVRILNKKVDGIQNSIVYEFLGNYWHGNPEMFNADTFNSIAKKTFGQLYTDTIKKFRLLKNAGYNIRYIWEKDWRQFQKGEVSIPNIQTF